MREQFTLRESARISTLTGVALVDLYVATFYAATKQELERLVENHICEHYQKGKHVLVLKKNKSRKSVMIKIEDNACLAGDFSPWFR